MGQYLTVGIVYDISIRKESGLTQEIAQAAIYKEFNSDFYNYSQNEREYCFHLKPEILITSKLLEFLEDQYARFELSPRDDKERQLALETVKNCTNGQDLIDFAERKNDVGSYYFQSWPVMESIKNPIKNAGPKSFSVQYETISFLTRGKIIMECYGKILSYFESFIRAQSDQYPIAQCVKVLISG